MKAAYKIMFFVSMVLTAAAVVVVAVFGLRFGIDFKGGSVMEIEFEGPRPTVVDLAGTVNGISGVDNVSASHVGENGALVRLNAIDEDVHQQALDAIAGKYGQITENRFDSIGPTIGNELKRKSIISITILLLAVAAYIAFVFRKLSGFLSSWAMSLAALIALVHDIIVPLGVFAILGHYYGVEITAVFVAAALTILGYSLADSVVVFDRIRENTIRFGRSQNFAQLTHTSIMQTLVRSLNTTFTTILSLVAIFVFGGESIRYFSLALIIGIFSGAYSSIFVASPILVWLSGKK